MPFKRSPGRGSTGESCKSNVYWDPTPPGRERPPSDGATTRRPNGHYFHRIAARGPAPPQGSPAAAGLPGTTGHEAGGGHIPLTRRSCAGLPSSALAAGLGGTRHGQILYK